MAKTSPKVKFSSKIEKQIFTKKSIFKSGWRTRRHVRILDNGFTVGHLSELVLKNSFKKLSSEKNILGEYSRVPFRFRHRNVQSIENRILEKSLYSQIVTDFAG